MGTPPWVHCQRQGPFAVDAHELARYRSPMIPWPGRTEVFQVLLFIGFLFSSRSTEHSPTHDRHRRVLLPGCAFTGTGDLGLALIRPQGLL